MGSAYRAIGFVIGIAAAGLAASAGISAARAADPPPAAGSRLEVNPKFTRPLPPPGYIADHRDGWVKEHKAYREPCQTGAVTEEIRYLNRIIGYDDYLMNLTRTYLAPPSVTGDEAAIKKAALAKATTNSLHNDIEAADSLIVRLQALPPCTPTAPTREVSRGGVAAAAAAPTPAAAPSVAAVPPAAAPPTLPPRQAPALGADKSPASPPILPPVTVAPGPTAPAPTPPPVAAPSQAGYSASAFATVTAALATIAAAQTAVTGAVPAEPQPEPAPEPAAESPPAVTAATEDSSRLVIRFVETIPALTPSGIKAFNEAVAALRAGKAIELAIDGCEAGADFSNGSTCARRRLSLRQLLTANGVRDTSRAMAGIR